MKKILLFIAALSFTTTYAQKVWQVEPNNTEALSPFAFSKESVEKGKEIFSKNCASCHGQPDAVTILPTAGNIKDAKFKADTDGELYYKITTGRGVMPSFKANLTPEDVWNLVSYIRSFDDAYVQQVGELIEQQGLTTDNIQLLLKYLVGRDIVEVKAMLGDSVNSPLTGIEVKLYAKRQFGDLQINGAVLTNKDGVATFHTPNDLPGDSLGRVNVYASVMPEGALKPIIQDASLQFGVPTNEPSLIAERAMWGKMKKIPIWLLLSYLVVVGTVLGFIGYCMLLLKKIFEVGKSEVEKHENNQ